MKRIHAVILSAVCLILIAVGCIWVVVPPFIDQFQALGRLVPQGIEKLDTWLDILSEQLDPRIINFLPDTDELNKQIQPLIQQFLGGGLTVFYNSLGVVLGILLLLAITLMLLANPRR